MAETRAVALPPMIVIGNFSFNPGLLVVVDRRYYTPGQETRSIQIALLQTGTYIFTDKDADEFNKWYLSLYSNLT